MLSVLSVPLNPRLSYCEKFLSISLTSPVLPVHSQDRSEAFKCNCVQALGPSLADEMEKRKFVPFPMTRIQSFGKDMCSAVSRRDKFERPLTCVA